MAATPSTMVPLGTQMPSFSLPDASGIICTPARESTGILIIFMCNHCPFVIHIAALLAKLHAKCEASGIAMYGINANDTVAYPDDAPEQMLRTAAMYNWTFPYLVDETQEIAKNFGAVCTPDVFLYDRSLQLFYRGQTDETRPNDDIIANGADLFYAIDQLVAGKPPPNEQKPAIGCNIKWK